MACKLARCDDDGCGDVLDAITQYHNHWAVLTFEQCPDWEKSFSRLLPSKMNPSDSSSSKPFDCGETMTIPGPNVSHPPHIAGCDRRLLSDTHVGRFLDPPAYVHVDGVFRARESLGELRVQQRGRVWQGEARQLNVRCARTPDVHKSTGVFDHRAQSRR